MNTRIAFCLILPAVFFACTPKTGQQTTTTTPTQPTQPSTTGPKTTCPTFDDAPNPDLALENFVLYRDFIKAGDWDDAWEKWQQVYKVAPAADGQRSTVFTDGVKFYEHFMAQDTTKRDEYITKIFQLYDELQKCYPEGGYVAGLKGFDYFFKYPNKATKEEQYKLFKQSIDLDKGEPRYFILNPFTAVLVDLALEEKIPVAEAKKYQQIIRDAIAKGLKECQGQDCDNWKIIEEYALARLEALESIEDFYDCAYYKSKYYKEFQENPNDCEVITNTYSRLKWGKCPANDPQFQALEAAYNEHCKTAPVAGPVAECNDALRDGRYRQAANCYENLLSNMTDNAQKAQINLVIAKIYYAYLKNYSRARQYALTAAKLRPNWGEPYMLIGTMYASSGPLCGPGRGWDSQVVVWPAIDMWQRAKSVDSGVAGQANRLISQYSQYMPSGEDIFQHGLKEGSSYYVGCWIQESTTIRAAN